MRTHYDATRGSQAITWHLDPCGGPPLDPPEYWELQADQSEDLRESEDECRIDFLTSVELD